MSASLVTSASTPITSYPCLDNEVTASFKVTLLMSTRTTLAFSWANKVAIAFPLPDAAPVTKAILLFNLALCANACPANNMRMRIIPREIIFFIRFENLNVTINQ